MTNIQTHIQERDTPTLKGWIVDLRGNVGENMWPMLVGVGPIVGEDTLGYSLDANNAKTAWRYEKGKALADGGIEAKIATPYALTSANPVVAVLTDTLTASSGEAVAVALRPEAHPQLWGGHVRGINRQKSLYFVRWVRSFADNQCVCRPSPGSVWLLPSPR